MSIAQDCSLVLRNSAARRINFSFERVSVAGQGGAMLTVNPSTFERVAQAIDYGRVEIEELTGRGGVAFRCGRRLRYVGHTVTTSRTPRIEVRPPFSREYQSTVIHESIHMSMFLTGCTGTTLPADEEAAARIAQHLYRIYTGAPVHLEPSNSVRLEMQRLAHRCAQQVIARGDIDSMTLERLLRTIEACYVYAPICP